MTYAWVLVFVSLANSTAYRVQPFQTESECAAAVENVKSWGISLIEHAICLREKAK